MSRNYHRPSAAADKEVPDIEAREPIVFLSSRALSSLLKINMRSLERWRQEGSGPTFVAVGRHVRYLLSDVEKWIETRRRGSTSASAAPGDAMLPRAGSHTPDPGAAAGGAR